MKLSMSDPIYKYWWCMLCNAYPCGQWMKRSELKLSTRPTAFQKAFIPLGKKKVFAQLFSVQLWIDSGSDWVL